MKVGEKYMAQAKKRRAPALTPEARENQLIAEAIDLAEKQITEGTASSAVICHYLNNITKLIKLHIFFVFENIISSSFRVHMVISSDLS